MFVKKLSLNHYRNYNKLELNTNHQVNIFIGPNAQGKTNLLEALYVLALTKSHRTNKDRELIQWDRTHAQIQCEVERKYGLYKLDLNISQQGKRAKVNQLEQKKLSTFIGALNVVMFAPEDLEIVKGSPGIRRRFLDMEIGQVQPRYLYHLQQYQKILQQRNNYLRHAHHPTDADQLMMEVWNEQLVEYGVKIIIKRQSFIRKLQQWAETIHAGITNGQEKLLVVYNPSFDTKGEEDETILFNQYMIKLAEVNNQEFRRGISLIGPHRDDLTFYINGKEVQTFGSQGQQRTTALSLKLAEIELIHEEVGEYPILLLDDVLSELDQYRQTQLIETIQNKVQTFITTTGIESIDFIHLKDAQLFHVTDGHVEDKPRV